ncbi:MAG: hypothetical protein WC454_09025 [Phycisphaerae bacterium]|jgi:hypothetical protein
MSTKENLISVVTTLAATDRIRVVTDLSTNPKSRSIAYSDLLALLQAEVSPMLIFSLAQPAEATPAATELKNDLTGAITLVRTTTGTYTLQLLSTGVAQAVFTEDKTILPNEILHTFTETDGNVAMRSLKIVWTSTTTLTITNRYFGGDLVDGFDPQTINIIVLP